MRPELDPHAFVLLRRPGNAPELTEAEGDALQEAHLDYLRDLQRVSREALARLPVLTG